MRLKERADAILEMMQVVQVVLEILVSIGIVICYLNSTLSTVIHGIVDKMFMEQRITIDRQTQTLNLLDKTISKMNALIETINERQHSIDKEIALLDRRVEDHESRIENFCQFCNREHQGDMPRELLDFIAYGNKGRGETQ